MPAKSGARRPLFTPRRIQQSDATRPLAMTLTALAVRETSSCGELLKSEAAIFWRSFGASQNSRLWAAMLPFPEENRGIY
jgi:hypothetical protein